eukprot:gb/GECH01014120.1/.p1 GENE.gb/GECH01014120.1/~~gb/GECH01014120.1/.p1  ORF type:complete len:2149 (+),score=474.31 gb/GECH01014120.1/:1-6447(+)
MLNWCNQRMINFNSLALLFVILIFSLFTISFGYQEINVNLDFVPDTFENGVLAEGATFDILWTYENISDSQNIEVVLEQTSTGDEYSILGSTQIQQGQTDFFSGWDITDLNPNFALNNEYVVKVGDSSIVYGESQPFNIEAKDILELYFDFDTVFTNRLYELHYLALGNISNPDFYILESDSSYTTLGNDYNFQKGINDYNWTPYFVTSPFESSDWQFCISEGNMESCSNSFSIGYVSNLINRYYVEGEELDIEWSDGISEDLVDIVLFKPSQGNFFPVGNISLGVNATQSLFTWDVETFGEPFEEQYVIRVINSQDSSLYAPSQSFYISETEKMITNVSSPDAPLTEGESYQITWETSGVIDQVRIVVSAGVNNPQFVTQIASGATGDSFTWSSINVGNFAGRNDFRFHIASSRFDSVFAMSDIFEIEEAPSLNIVDVSAAYLVSGDPYSIQWSYGGSISTVTLNLKLNGVFESEIASNVNVTQQSYDWTIDASQRSAQYSIEIVADSSTSISDQTQFFEIDTTTKSISVVSPGSDEVFKTTEYPIEWTKQGFIGNIDIRLRQPSSFLDISLGVVNAESSPYNWDVTQTVGTGYELYLVASNYPGISSTSNSFPINSAPDISVTTPSDYLITNSSYEIQFSSSSVTNVDILLMLSGSVQGTIALGIDATTSSYQWDPVTTFGGGRSPDYRFLIVDSSGGSNFVQSGGFEIDTEQKELTLDPISDVEPGEEISITWSSSGYLGLGSIALFRTTGPTEIQTLTSDVSLGTQSYNWTVDSYSASTPNDFYIEIVPAEYNSLSASSNIFEIAEPPQPYASIVTPSDYLVVGETYEINFNVSSETSSSFTLELCRQSNCFDISSTVSVSSSSFSWTVTDGNQGRQTDFYFKATVDGISGQSNTFEIDTEEKTVELTTPSSYWYSGQEVTIEFTVTGTIGSFTIELRNEGQTEVITTAASAPSYTWNSVDISGFNSPTIDNYVIDITANDYSEVGDSSDPFEIDAQQKSVSIDTPSVSYWYPGGSFNVSWSTSGNIDQVTVELGLSGSYVTLFTRDASSGIVLYAPEGSDISEWSTDYTLRIIATEYPSITAESGTFAADTAQKAITIDNIDRTTNWVTSSQVTIEWSVSGFVGDTVDITLNEEGGDSISIATGVDISSGSYDWSVSGISNPSDQRRFSIEIVPAQFANEATATSPLFAISSECPSNTVGPINGNCATLDFTIDSPATLDGCGDTEIQVGYPGSNSEFQWTWSVSASPFNALSFPSDIISEAESRISSVFEGLAYSESVSISGSEFLFGFCYTFSLTMEYTGNGQSGSFTNETSTCVSPFRSATLLLPNNLKIKPSQSLSVSGSILTRDCSSYETDTVRPAVGSSSFTYDFLVDGTSEATRSVPKVSFPPNSFSAGESYSISLQASVGGDYALVSPAVSISGRTEPVVSRISGGASRYASVDDPIQLDGSRSYDPSGSDSITYQWECVSESCDSVDFGGFPDQSVVTIAENTLEPDTTYTFQLTFSNGERTDSTSVDITTFDTPRAIVSITSYEERINPETLFVVTTSIQGRQPETTLQWSIVEGEFDLSESNPLVLTELDEANLVLDRNSLSQDNTYTFRLTATTGDRISSADASVTINSPPSGGSLTSDSTTGTLYETDFEFTASGFSDPDQPLEYEFGYYEQVNGNELFNSLSNGFGFENSVSSKIPIEGEVTVEVRVRDSSGSVASDSITVTVNPPQDSQAVEEQAGKDFSNSLTTGDVRTALVAFFVLVRALSGLFGKKEVLGTMNAELRAQRINDLTSMIPFAEDDPGFAQQLVQNLYSLTTVTSELNIQAQQGSLDNLEQLVMPGFDTYDSASGTLSNVYSVEDVDDPQRQRQRDARIQELSLSVAEAGSEGYVAGTKFQVFGAGTPLRFMRGTVAKSTLADEDKIANQPDVTVLELKAGLDASIRSDVDTISVFVSRAERNSYGGLPPANDDVTVSQERSLSVELRERDTTNSAVTDPSSLAAPIVFELPLPSDLDMESNNREYRCLRLNADDQWSTSGCSTSVSESDSAVSCECTATGTFSVGSIVPPPQPSDSDSGGDQDGSDGDGNDGDGGGGGGGSNVGAIVGGVIGSILGVILVLAIIGTIVGVVIYYRRNRGGLHDTGNMVPTYTDIDF